jgi:uncharacterized protein (TIGR00255 family)
VEITVSITSNAEAESAVSVNMAAARQYFKAFRELQREFDISGDVTLGLLASQPDIMKSSGEELEEAPIAEVIINAVTAAAADLNRMRALEGKKLADDLRGRGDRIGELLDIIEGRAPLLTGIYAAKLRDRVAELTAASTDASATEDRIALETAIFADKSNITEEIVRLRSHITQLGNMLGEDREDTAPVGKKLDFLVQEMNRETNTIGSKANDLKITEIMIEMKSEIEKIREQIQNIE